MYSKYKTVSIEDDLVFNSSTLKGFVTIVCGRVTHTKNFSKLLRRERRTKRGKSVSDFFFYEHSDAIYDRNSSPRKTRKFARFPYAVLAQLRTSERERQLTGSKTGHVRVYDICEYK